MSVCSCNIISDRTTLLPFQLLYRNCEFTLQQCSCVDLVVNNKEHSPVSGQRNVSKAPLAPGSAAPAVVRSTLVSDRDHFLTNIASFKLIIHTAGRSISMIGCVS